MTQKISPSALTEIQKLEEDLWRPETRFNIPHMDGLLSQDFSEFGRSGKIYDRAAVLAVPPKEIDAALPLPNFRVQFLSVSVALVTYDSHISEGGVLSYAHRSSIWVKSEERWVLHFHQGTPF